MTATERLLNRDSTSTEQSALETAPSTAEGEQRPAVRRRFIRNFSSRIFSLTCRSPQRALISAVVCCGLVGGIWSISSDGSSEVNQIIGKPTKSSTAGTMSLVDRDPELDSVLHTLDNPSELGTQTLNKGLLPFDVTEEDKIATNEQPEIVPAGGVVQRRPADGAAWLLGTIEEAAPDTTADRSDDLSTETQETLSR